MSEKRRFSLFLTIFVGIFLVYLILLFLFPFGTLAQMTILFQSDVANSVFLVSCSLFVALVLTGMFDLIVRILRRPWHKRKFGKILVSEGYITEGELKAALSEQSLRLGDVLYRAGRINGEKLDLALEYQKKNPEKLGIILRKMGYSSEEDIEWALKRMRRSLGEILQERGILNEIEMHRALALQQHGLRRM
jgi:hypothetical protein